MMKKEENALIRERNEIKQKVEIINVSEDISTILNEAQFNDEKLAIAKEYHERDLQKENNIHALGFMNQILNNFHCQMQKILEDYSGFESLAHEIKIFLMFSEILKQSETVAHNKHVIRLCLTFERFIIFLIESFGTILLSKKQLRPTYPQLIKETTPFKLNYLTNSLRSYDKFKLYTH